MENRRSLNRIMFVCHGNICRSTMAEFVMKDLANRAGRAADFVIASSATSTEEIGNDTHPGTKRVLAKHGVAVTPRGAVQLRASDYDAYDLFIGMDAANIRNMRRMLKGDPENKVHKLLEFAEGSDADSAADVADPWYTGDFETTYADVLRGCEALLAWLR
ncbi:MAG: low molecular weight protein-tyrosine-phosphatase [Slackia sp.]|nr:low molecular weight protein-tyrosine-phosphatase [Slackia sp.]